MLRDIADRASLHREVRDYTVDDIEMREAGDGTIAFDGIASVVGTPYTVRDQFGEFEETVKKAAFHRTLKQRDDVRMLKNHDKNIVFARTKSGTLQLAETPHLRASAPSLDPANPNVQTLRSELARGDVDQMSIGMRVKDQRWNEDYTEREILEVELFDVSVVTYPASPTTTAGLRSVDELLELDLTDVSDDEIRRLIKHLGMRFEGRVQIGQMGAWARETPLGLVVGEVGPEIVVPLPSRTHTPSQLRMIEMIQRRVNCGR